MVSNEMIDQAGLNFSGSHLPANDRFINKIDLSYNSKRAVDTVEQKSFLDEMTAQYDTKLSDHQGQMVDPSGQLLKYDATNFSIDFTKLNSHLYDESGNFLTHDADGNSFFSEGEQENLNKYLNQITNYYRELSMQPPEIVYDHSGNGDLYAQNDQNQMMSYQQI